MLAFRKKKRAGPPQASASRPAPKNEKPPRRRLSSAFRALVSLALIAGVVAGTGYGALAINQHLLNLSSPSEAVFIGVLIINASVFLVAALLRALLLSRRGGDLVSARNHILSRIFRAYRWLLPWSIVFAVGNWAFINQDFLNILLITLGFVFRIVFAIGFAIMQFVAIFWFMAQTKVETIRPEDPKSLTFADYWGQPNLLKVVTQWISLLSDRDRFVRMGGRYINGLLLYGEPGTGKCVTGDTRIITPRGYHRIDEIHLARTPDSYWPLNLPVGTVDGVKTASHFYVGGKSNTLRIRTYHGYELEGTPEHPVMCLRPGGRLEWVQLSQLTADDYVGIARNVEAWGARHISEADVLGILVGDGHIVSGRRVEFSTGDPEIVNRLNAWAAANGWPMHKAPAEHDWYIASTQAVRQLNQLGVAAVLAQDKVVPPAVWQADRESVRAFLQGLFDADGHADKDTGYVELTSSSHQLVKDVQLLLLKFGIMCRVTRRPVFHRYQGVRKQGVAWKLTLAGQQAALFYKRVGFGLERKQSRRQHLPATPNPNDDDVIPNIGPLLAGWQPRYVREECRPTYDMLERAVVEARLEHPTLNWLLEKRPIWSRVEAITPGEAEVYDITVPDGHAFVANGFISHNTMLAKCMAGEAGVAFISIEGSGFRAMFWGVDVLRMIWFVRKARKLAREYGACIAYIDELDAVGMSRGSVMGGGGQMGMGGGFPMFGGGSGALTRLLYEMDGIGESTRWERLWGRILRLFGKQLPPRKWHVLFMGSTNRPDVLDPALLRPGRFDQIIQVDRPDRAGRREIIKGYLSKIATDESVNLEAIVADTSGATPAKIMSAITKDAVRHALFAGRTRVSQADIDVAIQEQIVGIANPVEEMDPIQKKQIAYHEAGHAVVQHYVMPDQRISRVSIIRRARGIMGYVLPVDTTEIYAQPLRRIVADIMVSLAGHVAVKVFMGEFWTGAYSDYMSVRAQLRHLAVLGFFGPPVQELWRDAHELRFRDERVEKMWGQLEERVEALLRSHGQEVHAIATALLEREELSHDEVMQMLGPNGYSPNGRQAEETLPSPAAQIPAPGADGDGRDEPARLPVPPAAD